MLYKPIKVHVDNKPYFVLAFCPYDLTGFVIFGVSDFGSLMQAHISGRGTGAEGRP